MKILFVGDMRSPFIRQDMELLQEQHQVRPFDLSKHATSFKQIPRYLISSFAETMQVKSSDMVWIWFADYPALPFVILAKIFGKPVVVNVGGWEVYSAPDINYGNQTKPIRGLCTRWILRLADKIIVQSTAYENIVSNLLPSVKNKTVRIPLYIDTTLCDDTLPEKNNVVMTTICSSSNLKLKGIPTFLKAASAPEFQMRLFRNLLRDQFIQELKSAKVYCQLSYTEQFSVTTLEAMACGCIPVVSDRDGLPETVGDVGITVPFGDVDATLEAIRKAMKMDGTPARNRARLFTKARKAERIRDLISELMIHPECFGHIKTSYGGNNDMFPDYPCCECPVWKPCEQELFRRK
jgi:glycosyltransferase involved in cell wall biosynthesis